MFVLLKILTKQLQISKASKLFRSEQILPIKWTYSNREIKRKTNDSTYIKAVLTYKSEDGKWVDLETEIRARGGFRRLNCYYTPIKLKLKKSKTKGTLFKGNKKLKLVLPCLRGKTVNDKLIKEYLAYKLYEHISPYHFKTRLVDIEYTELKGKKAIVHSLKGFLIEDDKNVAERVNGKRLQSSVHPMRQDGLCSVQNAFFQFMIGNTDFSTAYQHNEKLLFIDKVIFPMPYDFDMSGLVNASYAVVSNINDTELPISEVTQRMYRGFKRHESILQKVRKEFLDNESNLLSEVYELKPYFENPKEFESALKYINSFFPVISDDAKFKKSILDMARTK